MKPYIIYQVMKADLLERARRPSFLAMCISAMFLAFFSVPDVEAGNVRAHSLLLSGQGKISMVLMIGHMKTCSG